MGSWMNRSKAFVLRTLLGERGYELWKLRRGFQRQVVQAHYPRVPLRPVDNDGRERVLVAMFNGFTSHGGLADRLRGIVSAYSYAREHGLRFAILWTSPFHLEDYLVPASFDWTISPQAVRYERPYACPIVIGSLYKLLHLDKGLEARAQIRMLDSVLARHPDSVQYHLYSNAHFGDSDYHRLFHRLFRPSARLQRLLDVHMQALGRDYLAMTFRFMHLLGDFRDERDGAALDEAQRWDYVHACLQCIRDMHARCPRSTILVTSDSAAFLREAALLPAVYVVRGTVQHIGSPVPYAASYDKEFVDLFLLARARTIYRVHKDSMYYSGFPLAAAMIGHVPVCTLEI